MAGRGARRRLAKGTAALLLIAGALLEAGPATATAATAPATATGPIAGATPAAGPAARPPARSAAVRAYWTRGRMAAARPAEQLLAAPPARVRRRAGLDDYLRRLVPGAAAALAADTGTRWARGGLVARTTGKVFFSLAGGDYVCSGSAVASGDRSTVATAGHCVYDPDDQRAATNWVFVPGYDRGSAPFGVFVATHLASMPAWRLSGDFDHDLAFANVDRNAAGKLLTDAVGGQAVGFDAPRGGAAVALGYPAQSPWDGERLIGCSGLLRQDTAVPATGDQGLACTMTGGSSGGPWLTGFDPVTGRGTLVSVTSFGYTDLPGVLWGPYLGSGAKALFQQVSSTTAA